MPRGSVAWTARRCGTGCTASMNGAPKGSRTAGRKATRRASRRSSWRSWRRSLKPARSAPCMESCAGAGWTCSRSWPSASASLTTSARSARSSSSSASRTSARVPAIRPRTRRPWRLLKKLRRDAEHSPRRPAERQADRDLVPGRSPHRPEERPRAAVGAARLAPTPARRSALRKRLPVRRHLPGARHRRGARHALRRQRGDATPPRRGLEPCPPRRPRRAPPRSGRLAYDPSLGRAEEHHPRLPALARPELNPVENIWQYLRQNWLSNRVFETYEAIIEAACEAWRSLLAEPTTITSIGHRGWAHVGQK